MSYEPATLMQAAAEVANLAGKVALRHFRTHLPIETKADGSPVTAADRDAELSARAWIEERFPDDAILGEELGEHVIAGAACFPALGEHIAAAHGCGCWWNGVECKVSNIADLGRATVLTTDERFSADPSRREAWARLAARAPLSRSWGDCYGYLLVATGRAEAMVDPVLSPWDAAPMMPIVEEAGGRFTDWNGKRTAFGGNAIATNAGVSREARLLLGAVGAAR
jgi:histidinol-phosphatase